jgi:hypothetical protein
MASVSDLIAPVGTCGGGEAGAERVGASGGGEAAAAVAGRDREGDEAAL